MFVVCAHTKDDAILHLCSHSAALAANEYEPTAPAVQDAIADKARLGEGNGVAQALISLGRILGPTLAGAFFSFGEAVGDVAAAFVVVALLCAGAGLSSVLVSRPGLEAA